MHLNNKREGGRKRRDGSSTNWLTRRFIVNRLICIKILIYLEKSSPLIDVSFRLAGKLENKNHCKLIVFRNYLNNSQVARVNDWLLWNWQKKQVQLRVRVIREVGSPSRASFVSEVTRETCRGFSSPRTTLAFSLSSTLLLGVLVFRVRKFTTPERGQYFTVFEKSLIFDNFFFSLKIRALRVNKRRRGVSQ